MANKPLFSPVWHDVCTLRPRLVQGAVIHRHVYRGETWFVIQNKTGNQYSRTGPAGREILIRLDGKRTVQEIWDELCNAPPNSANSANADIPSQTEVVDLLVALHSAELLQTDVTPDADRLFHAFRKKKLGKWKQLLMAPTSIKIPLLNPARFLDRTAKWIAPVFSRPGFVLWFVVVGYASLLALRHREALAQDLVASQLLSVGNLLQIALVFPVLKLLHELGHAFAVKRWGGTVHELGIMLLVFFPSPYVDASSASTFRSKWRRAAVGAAGMFTETFVAALALFFWLTTEPGLARSIAYNVMLISGVSTVVFNANPLLKYDGYFILSDLIEMPNLAQRGQKYYAWLIDRFLFGARDLTPPPETPSERRWLLAYTPAAVVYKIFVTLSIIFIIANRYFFVGVLLAIWSAIGLLVIPAGKAIRHIMRSPTLHRRRQPARVISAGIVVAALALLFLLPLPNRAETQGVVWLPDDAIVRAKTDGEFVRWLTAPGTAVSPGQVVAQLSNPRVATEAAAAEARLAQSEARLRAAGLDAPVEAALVQNDVLRDTQALQDAQRRADDLIVSVESGGKLVALTPEDAPGRRFKRGEIIAYAYAPQRLMIRFVVGQDDIDLLRRQLQSIDVRLSGQLSDVHRATVVRVHTGGVEALPSTALSIQGGGTFAIDPSDREGLKTLSRVFWVDAALPHDVHADHFGSRVHIRLNLKPESLAVQWSRRLRQLFINRFGV